MLEDKPYNIFVEAKYNKVGQTESDKVLDFKKKVADRHSRIPAYVAKELTKPDPR